jgi:hypothetical protein
MSLLTAVRDTLAPAGLNLVAALPVARYDQGVPERFHLSKRYRDAKSLMVIGNGGGQFWSEFQRYGVEHPVFCEHERHPLDAYTQAVVEECVPALLRRYGVTGHLVYPFRFEQQPVSFVHLGAMAGLGARSLLGMLVHPEYGPWMALRAAVVLDVEIEPTPVAPFDPCGTCEEKPCIRACPAAAISERGWDVPACTLHRISDQRRAQAHDTSESDFLLLRKRDRVRKHSGEALAGGPHHDPLPEGEGSGERIIETGNCSSRCDARWRCVYGRDHRYPVDALAYHQRRALESMRTHYAA